MKNTLIYRLLPDYWQVSHRSQGRAIDACISGPGEIAAEAVDIINAHVREMNRHLDQLQRRHQCNARPVDITHRASKTVATTGAMCDAAENAHAAITDGRPRKGG